MIKKISLLILIGIAVPGMMFAQGDSDAFMKIQAEVGYGGWLLGMMFDTGGSGFSPGGLTGAVQLYFGDVDGFMGGVEVAYLPLLYGRWTDGGDEFEASIVFLAASANAQINYGFGYSELGVGYGIYIGSTETISGGDSMDVAGPIFVKVATGLSFDIGDAMAINAGIYMYIPVTMPLDAPGTDALSPLLLIMTAVRAGVSFEF
jgi:hypothetical protein